ncbi:DUF1540 domain-containing protein [Paenibacillus piri]|uniref:DUF1540 domain-containing protein n=1 Tax=Paenibacillus piri TaxID=2547395 RepID=A0A4R5KPS2_9BACL|nr:DUF1540 domain-containing protein [Paenibacillus piri]TDF96717.1 DUF1540 domain-containing protein [Paenibacillus piri]
MPDVKCSVANCEYWAQGNNCSANSIAIDIDQHAKADLSAEFAEDLGGHQDRASSAANTCCHTFKAKK